jgi:hypothetical protein
MRKYAIDNRLTLAATIIAVITIFVVVVSFVTNSPQLDSKTFAVQGGFGYQIQVKDKIIIKQEYIPAVQGEIPFNSERDAQLVSKLVINKLLKKEDPVVTLNDLEKLNIEVFNRQ